MKSSPLAGEERGEGGTNGTLVDLADTVRPFEFPVQFTEYSGG